MKKKNIKKQDKKLAKEIDMELAKEIERFLNWFLEKQGISMFFEKITVTPKKK